LTPSGRTKLVAVIGSPVGHSLSPVIHNAGFAALGLDWVYVALEVAEGRAGDALTGMRALGVQGLSVTMPHKTAVAAAVDELSPDAARLRAVNCVVRLDDRLVGHNTDGQGLIDSLRREVGFEPAGSRCGVVGAGGAARAVVAALARQGAAHIVVVNRSPERAAAAATLGDGRAVVGSFNDLSSCDLVVNATPVGMGQRGDDSAMPFAPELLSAPQIYAELIYQPLETPFLAAVRRRGVLAVNGVGMLVHQAAVQFELWTGCVAPVSAMLAAVTDRLE